MISTVLTTGHKHLFILHNFMPNEHFPNFPSLILKMCDNVYSIKLKHSAITFVVSKREAIFTFAQTYLDK